MPKRTSREQAEGYATAWGTRPDGIEQLATDYLTALRRKKLTATLRSSTSQALNHRDHDERNSHDHDRPHHDGDVLTEAQLPSPKIINEYIRQMAWEVEQDELDGQRETTVLTHRLSDVLASHRALQLRLDAAEQRAERYREALIECAEAGADRDPAEANRIAIAALTEQETTDA